MRSCTSVAELRQVAEKTFEWMPNDTAVFNVTRQRSFSLPQAWTTDSLAIGVMLAGRFADDPRLLQLAAQIDQAQPRFDRRPPL